MGTITKLRIAILIGFSGAITLGPFIPPTALSVMGVFALSAAIMVGRHILTAPREELAEFEEVLGYKTVIKLRSLVAKLVIFPLLRRRRRPHRRPGTPGRLLDKVVSFFWSKKTYERVFKPARADIVHEWNEANLNGQRWKARWIKWCRGPYTMVSHMVTQIPVSIWNRLVALWSATK